MSFPQRGEIYMLEFRGVTGSEMRGWHPALIIQNDTGNEFSPVVIVASITSKLGAARFPHTVVIEPQESGLPHSSLVHCGQLTTADKGRLVRYIVQLPPARMREVDRALSISLGLEATPPLRPRYCVLLPRRQPRACFFQ